MSPVRTILSYTLCAALSVTATIVIVRATQTPVVPAPVVSTEPAEPKVARVATTPSSPPATPDAPQGLQQSMQVLQLKEPVLDANGLPEPVDRLPLSATDKRKGQEGSVKYQARIYAGKDRSSELLYRVKVGSSLRVLSTDGEWLAVALGDGKTGYILAKQVTFDPSAVPVSSPTKAADVPSPTRAANPSRSARVSGGVYAGTGDGHWIQEVTGGGKYIQLEDDSLWRVDSIDEVDAGLWLATEDITVRESSTSIGGYRLINKDNGETVGAAYVGD